MVAVGSSVLSCILDERTLSGKLTVNALFLPDGELINFCVVGHEECSVDAALNEDVARVGLSEGSQWFLADASRLQKRCPEPIAKRPAGCCALLVPDTFSVAPFLWLSSSEAI